MGVVKKTPSTKKEKKKNTNGGWKKKRKNGRETERWGGLPSRTWFANLTLARAFAGDQSGRKIAKWGKVISQKKTKEGKER